MKLTLENRRLALLIIQCWVKNIFRVVFLKPSSYISEITSENNTQNSLQPEGWINVKKVVKGVQWVSPLFVKKRKCLMEALIVNCALKKIGISSSFRLGAQTTDNSVKTHAWVSIGNKTIIGGPISGYEELIKIR